MASPSRQPAAKKAGWGSLLSGAVAGLESRLDTILANEDAAAAAEANATGAHPKPRPRTESGSGNLAPPKAKEVTGSRDASRSKTNDRLAERLAKATAAKTPSAAGSAVPSRTGTPVNERQSGESQRQSIEMARSVPEIAEPARDETEEERQRESEDTPKDAEVTSGMEDSTTLPPPRASAESSRPSTEVTREDVSTRPSSEMLNGTGTTLSSKSAAEYEAEMHTYLEKIDALQAKLSYLANSTIAAAKAANASTDSTPNEKQLAEKDEQIAQLMQEGEKLSKTELRHLQTIKKLRTQKADDDKIVADVRKKADKTEADLRQRVRKAEQAERAASEKNKVISGIEKEVEELRVDRENAAELVKSLTIQLKEAKTRAEKAEKEAKDKTTSEVDRGRIAALENDLEDAQIEKKLAEDRAAAEVKKTKEEFESQKQRFSVVELELKNEISGLEGRMEALRSRAEEQGVDGSTGESSVQLLRQVETLQRQYSLAKENWEAIEASLNARLVGLEKERDELGKREADARNRAREVGLKGRRTEEESERQGEEIRRLTEELDGQNETLVTVQKQFEGSQKAMEDLKAEHERQKRVWEVEVQQRIDEEKAKWTQGRSLPTALRNQSPATNSRKMSAADISALHSSRRPTTAHRLTSHELAALHTDGSRPVSRRSSGYPSQRQNSTNINPSPMERSNDASPSMSRQESTISLTTPADIPPTPSFELSHDPSDAFMETPIAETPATPDDGHTLADLLSTSTAPAAGPSVQLVERMSALVRRLESEKAAFKDEISRLSVQRDSARDEVVSLMREVEAKRDGEQKTKSLAGELDTLKGRYEASLEMLGEREEEVVELRSDVSELKRLYNELVARKVGGAAV
jgi:TATA element modulatory factor